jgi:hypothetical protein
MFAVSFAQNVVYIPLLFAENVVSLIALFAVLSLDVCSSLHVITRYMHGSEGEVRGRDSPIDSNRVPARCNNIFTKALSTKT